MDTESRSHPAQKSAPLLWLTLICLISFVMLMTIAFVPNAVSSETVLPQLSSS